MRDKEAWKNWPAPEAGASLSEWQAGRCAWCGDEARLVKDHCHMTGLVRGLLCHGCNLREANDWRGDWDGWCAGDNAARAAAHFEIYVGVQGTPLHPRSTLQYYSYPERIDWWTSVLADLSSGGDWPADAPWSEAALSRKADEKRQTDEAMVRLNDLLRGVGIGEESA